MTVRWIFQTSTLFSSNHKTADRSKLKAVMTLVERSVKGRNFDCLGVRRCSGKLGKTTSHLCILVIQNTFICYSFQFHKFTNKKMLRCDLNMWMNMCLLKGCFTFKRINDSSNLSEIKIRSNWFSSSRILFDTACWSLSFSLLKPRSHKLSPTSKWARKNEEMKKYRLNISLNAGVELCRLPKFKAYF